MRQAILITAYTNLQHLRRIIDWFDDDFDFYIHIDKKSQEDYSFLEELSNVHVYKRYAIQWGSDRHLAAIIYLIEQLLASKNQYDYCHLITGADFPIKSCVEFKQFFSAQNENNYIEYYPLPHAGWLPDGGLDRLRYYWIGHRWTDVRTSKWTSRMLWLQRKLHIHRRLDFVPQLYGGGTYWSLKQEALQYAYNRMMGRHGLWHHFAHSHIAEEIWMQSLILNNPEFKVENDYLRYMHWVGFAKSPCVLTDVEELPDMLKSNAFFARKFVPGESDKLLDAIVKHYQA